LTQKPLTELRSEFQKALEDIHAFSKGQNCDGFFTKCFANALGSLQLSKPLHGYHKDLSPVGILPAETIAILDSCQTAWVFGGMGSWNDMSLGGEDAHEYNRVSENLFSLLTQIIPAAANNSFKQD
jgi:hypothetical protein